MLVGLAVAEQYADQGGSESYGRRFWDDRGSDQVSKKRTRQLPVQNRLQEAVSSYPDLDFDAVHPDWAKRKEAFVVCLARVQWQQAWHPLLHMDLGTRLQLYHWFRLHRRIVDPNLPLEQLDLWVGEYRKERCPFQEVPRALERLSLESA